jgi:hypothetical protein
MEIYIDIIFRENRRIIENVGVLLYQINALG